MFAHIFENDNDFFWNNEKNAKLYIFELGEILDKFQINMSYRTRDMASLVDITRFRRHFVALDILC